MKTALTSHHPLHQDLGLLLLRAMLAVVFLWHGSQKLFGLFGGHGIDGTAGWLGSIGVPLPTLSAILAGASEFGGGVALATGLAFRLTLPPLVFTMLVAAFVGHAGKGFDVQNGGMEYPLTLAVAVTALILTGPGRMRLAPAGRLSAAVTA
ncbi:MAG: DoxX family protein [Planctomycetes bacterium]|nr:DoxX family protein [Planctomycetota bacterium]